jgi:nickel-dependent lactate racemase
MRLVVGRGGGLLMGRSEFEISYGDTNLHFSIPREAFYYYVKPRWIPEYQRDLECIAHALCHPIGAPPLADMVSPGMRIMILSDDNTRPTPKKQIIPMLLDELKKAGIKQGAIDVLIALGTHRYMTEIEIQETFGWELAEAIRIRNHEWADPSQLISVGSTPSGARIIVNKAICEADFIIGVGSIVPHSEAGWSGGGKIVQPGICGWETTAFTHLLAAKNPDYLNIAGSVDNPVRSEIEVIADRVGLGFILNVVTDPAGEIYGAVAGHPVEAHRKGVELARGIYECTIPGLADIVIVSAHPADLDYWQGDKPVTYSLRGLKPGGTLILVGRFQEGISQSHPVLEQYGTYSHEALLELEMSGRVDDKVGLAALFIHAHHMKRASIICVSEGLSIKQKENMNFIHADNLDDAVELALDLQGRNARIGIIDCGGDLLPVPEGSKCT